MFQGEKPKSQTPSKPAASTQPPPAAPSATPPASTSNPPSAPVTTSQPATASVPASPQTPTQSPAPPFVFPAVPPWGMMPPLWRPPYPHQSSTPVSMMPRFPYPPGHYQNGFPNSFIPSLPGFPPAMLQSPFNFATGNAIPGIPVSCPSSRASPAVSRGSNSGSAGAKADVSSGNDSSSLVEKKVNNQGSAASTSDDNATVSSASTSKSSSSMSNFKVQDRGDAVQDPSSKMSADKTPEPDCPDADKDSGATVTDSAPGGSTSTTTQEGLRHRRAAPGHDEAPARTEGQRAQGSTAEGHSDRPTVARLQAQRVHGAAVPQNNGRVTRARFSLDFSTVVLTILSLCTLFLLLRRIAFTIGWF